LDGDVVRNASANAGPISTARTRARVPRGREWPYLAPDQNYETAMRLLQSALDG
jgi:hypothetical protein